MPKFCACGRDTCAICKGKSLEERGLVSEKPVTRPERNANIRRNADIRANANVRVTQVRRNPVKVTVEEDGAIAVDCACGCGRKVYLRPAYFSSACRSRAWRKRRVDTLS